MAIVGTGLRHTKPVRRSSLFELGDVVVRELVANDSAGITIAANFSAIARMTVSLPHPYRRHHARDWITRCRKQYGSATSPHRHYVVTRAGQIIGMIGADRQGDQAEIGYWLTPAVWGQGMMTKVVGRFVPQLFRWWTIERVVGRVFVFNAASARVLVKNHFRRTALQLAAVRKGHRRFNVLVYTRHRAGLR